jgi:hypothetical protein
LFDSAKWINERRAPFLSAPDALIRGVVAARLMSSRIVSVDDDSVGCLIEPQAKFEGSFVDRPQLLHSEVAVINVASFAVLVFPMRQVVSQLCDNGVRQLDAIE